MPEVRRRNVAIVENSRAGNDLKKKPPENFHWTRA